LIYQALKHIIICKVWVCGCQRNREFNYNLLWCRRYKDGNIIINVDRIITRAEEKLAGNRMIVFKCQSVFDSTEKLYELKYEINTCKWFLYKMW